MYLKNVTIITFFFEKNESKIFYSFSKKKQDFFDLYQKHK